MPVVTKMAAPIILTTFWAWGAIDNFILSQYGKTYKPSDIPEHPTYTPEKDVTLIVPTVDTPDSFPDSLRTWLSNNPREIIIVTTNAWFDKVNLLLESFTNELASGKIKVMTAKTGKRKQLVAAIPMAQGRIVAMSDDDTYWKETFLEHMLPCFEDPAVGGAGGSQNAHILPEHRHENLINAWEVASLRILEKRNGIQAAGYAADGGVFVLAGRSVLFRKEIINEPKFIHEFTHETWRGKPLNTGDDCFLSRWVQEKGWQIAIQHCPETDIETVIPTDSAFIGQLKRWERSTIQSFIRSVTTDPLLWSKPRVARKMIERLLRPWFTTIQIWAWCVTMWEYPLVGLCLLGVYMFAWYKMYSGFLEKYPYTRCKLWAAIMIDHVWLVLDPYAWLTVNDLTWVTRDLEEKDDE